MEGIPALRLERGLRGETPPVIARIWREEIVLDVRTVEDDEVSRLARLVAKVCACAPETRSRNGE
jgi:seryl-tRNA(Sec) selenium transferase